MLPVDTDPRFARFTLRTDCGRCGAHLPVNGPVAEVGCADCGHHTPVPDTLWVELFRDVDDAFPTPTTSGRIVQGDTTWRWTAEVMASPRCQQCDEVLNDASGVCATCGRANTVTPLREPIRQRVRNATSAIGAVEDLSRPKSSAAPVALACPQCGGGLSITADQPRLTVCPFCATQVHLPDAVWRHLHPPREVVPFTVRFEGEARAAVTAREKAEEKRRQSAKQAKRRKEAEERAERERQAEARRAVREAERQAAEARRLRSGSIAVGGSSLLCLFALVAMAPTPLLYFFPGLLTGLGASVQPVRIGLMTVGGLAFFVAWFAGHVALAWRSGLRKRDILAPGAMLLVMVLVPGMSLFAGPAAGYLYTGGKIPMPSSDRYKDLRHPVWTTAALALLLAFGGLFWSVIAAHAFGVSLLTLFPGDSD